MERDDQILKLLKSRDEKGIELLYDYYSDALYGIAARILNHPTSAQDCLQKSFLKIWKNIDQYDPNKATLYTWMAQIVRNTSIDTKRLKSFKREYKSESIESNVYSLDSDKINTDKIDAVKMIDGLDEKYSFVLENLYLRGYTQSELADEFDIPIGTIKTRVKKALQILRNKLDGEKGIFLASVVILLITVTLLL